MNSSNKIIVEKIKSFNRIISRDCFTDSRFGKRRHKHRHCTNQCKQSLFHLQLSSIISLSKSGFSALYLYLYGLPTEIFKTSLSEKGFNQ